MLASMDSTEHVTVLQSWRDSSLLLGVPDTQLLLQVAVHRQQHEQEHGEVPDQQGAAHQGDAGVQALGSS